MGRIGRFFRPHLVTATSGTAASAPPLVSPDQAVRFREIMLPHMDAAYGYARFLLRDSVAAEDVVQDAFLRAFRSFHTFRGEAPKAWLLAIVRNCYRDLIKAQRDQADDGASDADGPPSDVDHDHPEAILMRQHEAEGVRTTIANLPEPFRETIVLRELEELSYREIAALTGVPIGTVMSRLARAREMLAALLSPSAPAQREARS